MVKGHNELMQGFLQTLDSKHTDYDVLDIFETQDSEEIAYQKAMVSFSQHPTPNCVYVIAAGAGGVCRAMRELGREFRYVITNDDVPTTQKYLMRVLSTSRYARSLYSRATAPYTRYSIISCPTGNRRLGTI